MGQKHMAEELDDRKKDSCFLTELEVWRMVDGF